MAVIRTVWAVHLGSAIGVAWWAILIPPKAGPPPVWVAAIGALLLVAAYLLARRGGGASGSATTLIAAWSLSLAAVSLSAAGRWLGSSAWELAAIAATATVLLFISRPLPQEQSLENQQTEDRREHPE